MGPSSINSICCPHLESSPAQICLRNQNGFSLVEAMVFGSIVMIILMALAQSNQHLQMQVKAVQQKQEIVDLKTFIAQQLSRSSICSWQLAHPSMKIDVSGVTTSLPDGGGPEIKLKALHQGLDTTSPVLVAEGALPGTQTGIKVESISFRNIYFTGIPDEYRGSFVVVFDNDSLVRALRPVRVETTITTDPTDPPTAKRILSCGIGGTSPKTLASRRSFCDTYRAGSAYGCPTPTSDGRCRIPDSSQALGCFLTSVDDDTGRIGYSGVNGIPAGSIHNGRTYGTRDNSTDDSGSNISDIPKCEVGPDPAGNGWYYRAWFDCEVVACTYMCLYN